MATETLEDNKPPIQGKDDDPALPKPNEDESEAAQEPKVEEEPEKTVPERDDFAEAAESEKNVEEKGGGDNQVEEEGDEKEEANEHEEEEKDDEDDEEEDKEEEEEGDEEEQEGEKVKTKGRTSKKNSESEKKSPVTPVIERPTRERKTVERFSLPSPSKLGRSSASKSLTIEKGRGTQLKDIPNVAFKLSKRKPDENLHILHNLLFGKRTKAHNLKRNISQFSGYVWAENEEKQRAKVKERIDKCVKEKLLDFCDVLNIQINKANVRKEELSAKLLEFLESPHATTDVLLAEKEQKGKKRSRKATPSKSPGEASMETPGKKRKQTPPSGKKRKQFSDADEDDKAELSDAKDESQDDEDVAVPNNESDEEGSKSEEEEEEEEDKSKVNKRTSKKSVKEGSVAKGGDRTPSDKKTSAKAAKGIEKSLKKSSSKKTGGDHDSASVSSPSKSKQPASKKQKTVTEKQDTKGKAASKKQTDKSPKVSAKDQGKGKSNKKAKAEPSREDMHAIVVRILKEVDFNTATLSDILRQLGTHFGLDLMHRKAEVKDIITDVINNMSDEEDEGEQENDGDGDADNDDDGDDDEA